MIPFFFNAENRNQGLRIICKCSTTECHTQPMDNFQIINITNCLSSFCAVMTEYLRQIYKEQWLISFFSSGGKEVQDWGVHTWQWSCCYIILCLRVCMRMKAREGQACFCNKPSHHKEFTTMMKAEPSRSNTLLSHMGAFWHYFPEHSYLLKQYAFAGLFLNLLKKICNK
jgi:hypothetical protein